MVRQQQSKKLIQHITSLQNPRIKKALKLHSSRGRKDQDRVIVFGKREFERAANSKFEFEEVFLHPDANQNLLKLAQSATASEAALATVSGEVLSKLMFGDRPDLVVGIASRPTTSLAGLKSPKMGFVLVLQAIEKPGNLGAILRSADACGAAAVLLADSETDFFHPNSIRASTGAVFKLPIAAGSSEEIQKWILHHQFRVLTAIVEGATDVFEADLTGNVAFVLGNEACGLDQQWRNASFQPIRLPMCGIADSLNVSVTASVMMYEAVRQRALNS